MRTIVLASNNPHKAEEMNHILGVHSIAHILMPKAVLGFPENIPETGETLEENAYIKASAVFSATLHSCIADDTGLEVDALGGAPGVHTARYAGEKASYADNRTKMLEALRGIPESERTARFRTVLCYHDPLRIIFAEGVCSGRISAEERGTGGFGYDSIFIPEGFSATFAELSNEQKNTISHRARAIDNLANMLRQMEISS